MKKVKTIVLIAIIIIFGSSLGIASNTNRIARKHLVLGDQLFKQKRIAEAIQEWKIALQLDKTLSTAKENIEVAKYYQKHGRLPEKKEPEVIKVGVKDLPSAKKAIVKTQKQIPIERIQADILEIEKVGGRAVKIIINVGTDLNIGPGMEGIVAELNGAPLAAFRITASDAEKSLAKVISLNRDVSDTAVAIVDRPK